MADPIDPYQEHGRHSESHENNLRIWDREVTGSGNLGFKVIFWDALLKVGMVSMEVGVGGKKAGENQLGFREIQYCPY